MTELEPFPYFMAFVVILSFASVPLSSLAIQKFSRWGEISEKYPSQSEFTGKWLRWQTLAFRAYSGAKGCIDIGIGDEFLYVKFAPQFLFPFLKPIQIPWTRIAAIKEKKIFWYPYCEFFVQDAPSLTFYLSRALRKSLQSYSGSHKVVRNFNKPDATFPDSSF